MSENASITTGVPIRPSVDIFREYEPLMALCECWEKARGDRMLPAKSAFEGVMLDYPEMLPDMALLKFLSGNEARYVYFGGEAVRRRRRDQTRERLEESVAPNVRNFLADWTAATFKIPGLNFVRAKIRMASGMEAENVSLSAVLSNEDELPSCIAYVTVLDGVFSGLEEQGEYLIGSAGMVMHPIDIGYGVSDLPRTID